MMLFLFTDTYVSSANDSSSTSGLFCSHWNLLHDGTSKVRSSMLLQSSKLTVFTSELSTSLHVSIGMNVCIRLGWLVYNEVRNYSYTRIMEMIMRSPTSMDLICCCFLR